MVLKLENVKKKYENFELDCSMEVEENTIVGLVGANGAGKSTTFKAILDLIHIDGGSIEVDGHKELTSELKKDIGVVLTDATMQKFLTIREIAGMLQIAYDKFVYDDFIIECEKFKLPLDKAIKSFSTGMLAKLKLLIAMSYDANLLILDEPTSGLDTVARNELLNKIKKYAKSSNKAVLMSSHIGSDLKKICDILYFMKDGKIIYKENTHTLLNEYVLIDMEDISSIDKNDILFELKDDDFYSLIIKKKDAYLPYIRSNFDIDDMIEVVMRGDKGEGINL